MKKIIALLICLITIFSNEACATPYENAENAEKILIDFFYNHKDNLYPNTVTDIEDAFLADIDNDGIPELLFSRYIYWYGLTVYKVKDGKVIEIPDRINFGTGTGIREDISLLMDKDGHMYIYREGEFTSPFIGGSSYTHQVIYDWSENGLTPLKYLGIDNYYVGEQAESKYTTDLNAVTNLDLPKTQISSSEADAKFAEFKNQLKSYIAWSEADTDKNSGLNRIWNQQKEKYEKNTTPNADKYIVLQIGNSLMNVDGSAKAIDTGIGTTPVIKDGRTLIPVRAVVEEMGGTVDWDAANNMAILSYSGKTIKLVINSNIAYLNDVKETLDVAPVVMNGRTMLPIRFIAESFGFDVDWRELTQQIVITGNSVKDDDKNVSINYALLSCIGKTKEEITGQYGNIVGSEYWMGGKYYIYDNLKSQIFYENPDGVYDYNKNDDVESSERCLHMFVNLSELLNTPNKKKYTVEELQHILGNYEFSDDLDNDFYPLCFYKFTFGDYVINIESEQKNPLLDYVYVYKK
ncbi:MAG: copper amine oxidase N-terminal domain-containing protein [Ruminococcaceae bacterium]|nr:copper amine oxidase N-terminal domain-containing protein [Oscillospiraceae bacterium]